MKALTEVCGKAIAVRGRIIRIGRIDWDKFKFLDDPEYLIAGCENRDTRIDLFTFMQGPPASSPKYSYPMEWDNMAVLSVSTSTVVE